MRVLRLRYKNFLSTGNDFIDLDMTCRTTIIYGENGTGKSTFVDAFVFSLFGRAYRGSGKPISKKGLVNKTLGTGLVVEITFIIGNTEYVIERGINYINIFINGEQHPEKSLTNAQAYITNEILGMTYDEFVQQCIVSASKWERLLRCNAEKRRKLVENLLGIQFISKMKEMNRPVLNSTQKEVDKLENGVELLKSKIEITENYNKKITEDAKPKIQTKLQQITEKKREKKELQKHYQEALLVIEKSEHEELLKKVAKAYVSEYDNLKSRNGIIDYDIQNKQGEIEHLEDHDSCVTCHREYSPEFTKESIEKLQEEISQLKEEKNRNLEKLETLDDKKTEVKEKLLALQQANNDLTKYNEEIVDCDEFIEEKIKEIDELKVATITDLTEEKKELKKKKKLLSEKTKELEYYKAIDNSLKDDAVKAILVKQFVPLFNQLSNKHLSDNQLSCEIELNENFEITLISRHREEMDYENFSEGEKMRIDLSIHKALQDINKMRNPKAINLIIYDEVIDSALDTQGTSLFVENILNVDKNTSVFVISHKTDEIVDKFERRIRSVKEQGFTKYYYE